ncbi:MAG TPA: phage tail protein [Steroidobacteraceae bacterium]|nr:phage tail protein [Steroidobacteraceae bacterium]
MDANGLRSFGLSFGRGLEPWRLPDGDAMRVTVERDDCHLVPAVRLADRAAPAPFRETPQQASDVVLAPSLARDRFGNFVTWHAGSATLYSVSAAADEFPELQPIAVPLPESAKPVRDLAFGADDVLYVAGADGIWLIDMRARFEPVAIRVAGFEAHRLAADRTQGVWVLDVSAGRLARLTGLPPFTTGVDVLRERNSRFEASEPAPRPPRLRVLPATLGAGERAVALATHNDLVAALIVGPQRAGLRLLDDAGRWSAPVYFDGPRFPHSFSFLDDTRFAVIGDLAALDAAGNPQPERDLGAFSYRLEAGVVREARAHADAVFDPLAALGDYHPLTGRASGPLANAAPGSAPAAYFPRLKRYTFGGADLELAEPAPLARLSLAARAPRGAVANFAQEDGGGIRAAVGLVDTRNPATAWHRLNLECSVPRGTAMIVWLATSDGDPPVFSLDPAARGERHAATWFPHVVGDLAALPRDAQLPATTPRAAWLSAASDVPAGASLLGIDREPGITGLFTVLVQRAGLTVRTLAGRRLWAVVELFGDGRATPELVALRAWSGRVSYRDRYLPALYREQVYGAEANRAGRATGADYLERFIDLFEGVFTDIEDRIANAHLVTDVAACPPEALPWLGAWIGYALEDLRGPDAARRARNMLLNAPALARRHGTLDGLRWALDIATDGGVTRGRLVVLENFRLRRTMATILGADLADENDPLTLGITQSGNSFVGDSLFLGDEHAKTFLALFRTRLPDAGASAAEQQRQNDERDAALHALYDGLAQRATVLVHDAIDSDELRRVRRLSLEAAPAHVAINVIAAKYPFLVAVASLVGADTYLRAAEKPDAVRVGASKLGYLDTLQGTGTLDAALGSFGALGATDHDTPPIADPGPDREVDFGARFTLDGSASRAATGRFIDEYRWRLLPPADPE